MGHSVSAMTQKLQNVIERLILLVTKGRAEGGASLTDSWVTVSQLHTQAPGDIITWPLGGRSFNDPLTQRKMFKYPCGRCIHGNSITWWTRVPRHSEIDLWPSGYTMSSPLVLTACSSFSSFWSHEGAGPRWDTGSGRFSAVRHVDSSNEGETQTVRSSEEEGDRRGRSLRARSLWQPLSNTCVCVCVCPPLKQYTGIYSVQESRRGLTVCTHTHTHKKGNMRRDLKEKKKARLGLLDHAPQIKMICINLHIEIKIFINRGVNMNMIHYYFFWIVILMDHIWNVCIWQFSYSPSRKWWFE